ncbi:hypothetical protein [Mesorhizobium sp. M0146]|uniref:hypothetical protein n=1 Tax=unclassified Mesorhizobium TaxID=325217 RepID=UPI0033388503
MKASDVKPGDKVRALKSYPGQFTAGKEYTVKSVGTTSIAVERDDAGSRTNGWGADNFEPAYTSCAAAEVDNLADEYGSPKAGPREPGYRFTAKDKPQPGDRVSIGDNGTFTVKDVLANGNIRFTDRPRDLTWLLHSNASVSACTLVQAANTLRIEAGRYYKTLDGRKVGPMEATGTDVFIWHGVHEDGGVPSYTSEGYWWDGKSEDTQDLVSEWSDPVEQPVVAPATTAKFKVGDRVKFRDDYGSSARGKEATVIKVDEWGVQVDRGGRNSWGVSTEQPSDLVLLPPATIADIVGKHSIVCLIENGQPKPSTLPFVHADKDLAATEAARLAGKHPGQEFGVYELVTTRKEAKVYRFAWQNKAAQGEKIDAIRSLRTLSGVSLKQARDTVDGFLADAASYETWLASEAA